MDELRMRSARIVGRGHLNSGKNRQDSLKTGTVEIDGKNVFYGVICDGCSEGVNSEVGANLASAFLGRHIEVLVKSKIAFERIPAILDKRLLGFLRTILGEITFDSPRSRVDFIKDNLLFTVLGFMYREGELVLFVQGDGVMVFNDGMIERNENDLPRYIGYNLVERKFLASGVSALQEGFDVMRFSGDITRFAIASDALLEEPDFVGELWGHDLPIGLQRRVNAASLVHKKFQDDLSIITLEKIPKEG